MKVQGIRLSTFAVNLLEKIKLLLYYYLIVALFEILKREAFWLFDCGRGPGVLTNILNGSEEFTSCGLTMLDSMKI